MIANVKWVLEESFKCEARHKTGCNLYECSDVRVDHRNGYRTQDILTRFGRLKNVRVPRFRYSGFVPSILQRGRFALSDVEKLMVKCLLFGASRRKVVEMLALLLGYLPCGSILARVQLLLDRQAEEFRRRELTKVYKYLFLNALSVKIRRGRLAKESMVLVAVGIDRDGRKEVIGYIRSKLDSGAA